MKIKIIAAILFVNIFLSSAVFADGSIDLSKILILYLKTSKDHSNDKIVLNNMSDTLNKKLNIKSKIYDAKFINPCEIIVLDGSLWMYDLELDERRLVYQAKDPISGRIVVDKSGNNILIINDKWEGLLVINKKIVKSFNKVYSAQFSKDGNKLYFSDEDSVFQYDVKNDKLELLYKNGYSNAMKISENEDKIAILDTIIPMRNGKKMMVKSNRIVPYEPAQWTNNDKYILFSSGQGSCAHSYDLLLVSSMDATYIKRIQAAFFIAYLKAKDLLLYTKSLQESLDLWDNRNEYELHIMNGDGSEDTIVKRNINIFNRGKYRYLDFYYNE